MRGILAGFALILGFAPAGLCYADQIAVVPGSGGSQNANWNQNVTLGWQFTLSSPVTATQLGFFDATGNGLPDPHPVAIFTGDGGLLGSATVPAGTAGALVNGFRFVPVTPFTLQAGSYAIGAYGNSTSPDQFAFGLSGSTTISGLTLGMGVEAPSAPNTPTFPNQVEGFATQGYFGPNFMTGAGGNNPTPAISSLSPSSATAGSSAFTLTVNGSNFVSASVVQWGGTALTTTFVSAAQLTASVSAALIASPGPVNVTVVNPGPITSAPATFTVSTPQPVLLITLLLCRMVLQVRHLVRCS